jgi:hypothetical protein
MKKVKINLCDIHIYHLKIRLMYLETPDARKIMGSEERSYEIKITTDQFRKYIKMKHDLIDYNVQDPHNLLNEML